MNEFWVGKVALHPAEALLITSLSSSLAAAKKTARNLICLGRYPFPLTHIGGRPRVLVRDLVEVLGLEAKKGAPSGGDVGVEGKGDSGAKRRPGRPTKKSRLGT